MSLLRWDLLGCGEQKKREKDWFSFHLNPVQTDVSVLSPRAPSWSWKRSRWPLCHQETVWTDEPSSHFSQRLWCTLSSHHPGQSGWCQSVDSAPGTPADPQRSGQRRYAADCSHGADRGNEDLGKNYQKFYMVNGYSMVLHSLTY